MLAIPHAMCGRRPVFPPTPADFAAVTGKTVDAALYLHNEASGNLIDYSSASRNLTKNGAPTYLTSRNGRYGTLFPNSSAYFAATISGWNTAASFVFGGVTDFSSYAGAATLMLIGGTNTVRLFMSGGQLYLYVADPAPFSAAISSGAVPTDTDPTLCLGQIDLSTNTGRVIRARRGAYTTNSGSIASWAGIGTATPTVSVGSTAGSGLCPQYSMILTGSQAEGASVLTDLAGALGWL